MIRLNKYLKELITEEDPDKELENVIKEVKDELEKDTNLNGEKSEQTIKIGVVCKSCGTKMICPVCDNIEKDEDDSNDPFQWLFSDHQTNKSKDGSHEKQTTDELLNSIIHED